jgi:hypothetical protein
VLRNTIAMTKPGTTVALDVVHQDGSKDVLKVKLGAMPDDTQSAQQQQGMPRGFKVPPGYTCKRTPNGVECYGGNGFGRQQP